MEGRAKKKSDTSLHTQPVVVIPNLNGGADILAAIRSLTLQTLKPYIIVVDNASTDDSVEAIIATHPDVELIRHTVNKGYAGGVNPGLRRAIERGAEFVAPFNDDATADPAWLATLVDYMRRHDDVAGVAPKVLHADGLTLDSTGEAYTNWGLAYPRGRGEIDTGQYDASQRVFGVSGAACLYRVSALEAVGLLDEDFFAYYEDVDLSFRFRLAGYELAFVPAARVYHKIGMTGSRTKGFYTYQTMKNLPLLAIKNVPKPYMYTVIWRLTLARSLFMLRAISRGHGWAALRGDAKATGLIIKKMRERRQIQAGKRATDEHIWNIMTHDLPPGATALRRLRSKYRKLNRKRT